MYNINILLRFRNFDFAFKFVTLFPSILFLTNLVKNKCLIGQQNMKLNINADTNFANAAYVNFS